MKKAALTAVVILVTLVCSTSFSQAQFNRGEEKPFDAAALKQLADRGSADAQFELGIRLLGGEGMAKDETKAAEWLRKAAAQSHLPAMNALGTLCEEGVGLPKDAKKAFDWYKKAAQYGLPLAQQNLAECYDLGKGVEANPEEAAKWIQRAANQDFPPAQAQYGWKLEHGKGVKKDMREAAVWYLKAAQQGLVAAMTHLAYLYYTGQGVPLDYRRAEAWYRLAAKSEDPWAHNDLAWFLATCPDENFHDPEGAIEFARSAAKKLTDKRYEAIDTLAAALARSGQFGEAVQTQMKAIMRFSEDKEKEVTPEERAKLEQELTERLAAYRKRQPYTEKDPAVDKAAKPLLDDRILQEVEKPNRKRKPSTNDGERGSVIS